MILKVFSNLNDSMMLGAFGRLLFQPPVGLYLSLDLSGFLADL